MERKVTQIKTNSNIGGHKTKLNGFDMQKRKFGFTLAEVLITLAVIGVVAALTIPTLVQSYKKSVVETKLAKFYSVMNNAIRMAEVDYGSQTTWSDYYVPDKYDDDNKVLYYEGDKYDALVNKYFAPYLKITGSEEIRNVPDGISIQKAYYLADGSAFAFSLTENREIIFYIRNPKECFKKSDKSDVFGICGFVFSFIPASYNDNSYKYNIGNGMQPYLYQWDGDEESLMNSTSYGCKNGIGAYCTEIIRRNGWKIPKDYPFKF